MQRRSAIASVGLLLICPRLPLGFGRTLRCCGPCCCSRRRLCSGRRRQPPSNHYQALGLSPNATDKDIRDAFIRQSKLCHPDSAAATGASAADSHERFVRINEAYSVLSKEESRRSYDAQVGLLHRQQRGPSADSAFSARHTDYRGPYWQELERWQREQRFRQERPFPTREEYEQMANRVFNNFRRHQEQHRRQREAESFSSWQRQQEDELDARLREIRMRQRASFHRWHGANRQSPMQPMEERFQFQARAVRLTLILIVAMLVLSSSL